MNMAYFQSIRKQFEYYKMLGDRTFDQLAEADCFWQYDEDSNSIGIIIKHLWGNMLSRWTNFLTEDGEKEWRKRDEEFEPDIRTKEDLYEKWEAGWACLFTALDSVNEHNMDQMVYIRNQAHSIPEAINRQLAHYAYHIGQIVFLGKMIKGKDWQSLSIPKGGSKAFNVDKFSKEKNSQHYTQEFLDGSFFEDGKGS